MLFNLFHHLLIVLHFAGSSTNSLADLPYESAQLTGVAFLDGFIYATSKRSNAIIVYDSSTLSYTRLGDIVIDGLKAANDLAADPTGSCCLSPTGACASGKWMCRRLGQRLLNCSKLRSRQVLCGSTI